MSTIYQWIAGDFASAFCRMLLHSLWIGVAAAFLAGIIILTTRKTSARARYNGLVALYTGAVACAVLSFFRELKSSLPAASYTSSLPSDAGTDVLSFPTSPIIFSGSNSSLFASVISFLDQNSLMIICIWLYIFLFRLVKVFFGLRRIHILEHQRVRSPDERWLKWIRQKADELGVQKKVLLLQSELIKIPVAIGHLKPVVLVPLGLLAQLSPEQVESILVHELAHIKRKDYLINLLQTITDAVFFFNPAFLWLSSLIRQEREKCCDDIVIQHSDRSDYLEALVSFQEITYRGSYAMALGRTKNSLLNRIKRMLTKENSKLSSAEVSMLLLGMMVIAFSFMAFTSKGSEAAPPVIEQEPQHTIIVRNTATVEKKKQTVTHKPAAHRKADTVPSKPKPPREDFNFKQIISNISDDGTQSISQVQATTVDGTVYKIRREQQQIVSISVNGKEVQKEDYPKYYPIINAIEQRSKAKSAVAYKAINQKKVDQRKQQLFERKKTMLMVQKKNQYRRDSLRKIYSKPDYKVYKSYKVPTQKYKVAPVYRSSTNTTIAAIIRDLFAGKLVTGEDFSFSLTYNEFKVNGEVQSQEVLEKFRAKYLKDPANHFFYSKKGGTTKTDVYVR